MGWDTTTELTACVVDSVNVLTRLLANVNSERADMSPIPRVERPYEAPVLPETVSLAAFGDLLRE